MQFAFSTIERWLHTARTAATTPSGRCVQTFSALNTSGIDAWRFSGTTFGAITQLPLAGADYARIGAHGTQLFVGWRRANEVRLAKLDLP